MGIVTKIYHRGNDDKKEGIYLTAIFVIKLIVDTSNCKLVNDRENPQQQICTGDVKISLDVEIRSPKGIGNGNKTAAKWSKVYGLLIGKKYVPFKATIKGEYFKLKNRVELGTIPCKGGGKAAKVIIQMFPKAIDDPKLKNYAGPAYIITGEVDILPCGKIKKEDFILKQGKKAFALDAPGGQLRNKKGMLIEVKPGIKPPFGTKTKFPPAANDIIDKDGEIITKKK